MRHNLLDIVVVYGVLLLCLVGLPGPLERRVRLVMSVRVTVVAASSVRMSVASSVGRDGEGEAPEDDEHDGDAGDSPPRRYRCRHRGLSTNDTLLAAAAAAATGSFSLHYDLTRGQ